MSRSLYEQRFTLRAETTACESAQRIGVVVSEPTYHFGQKRYVVEIRREPLLVRAAPTTLAVADARNGEARSLTAQSLAKSIAELDAVIANMQTHQLWLHRALREFREQAGDVFEQQLQAATFAAAVQMARRDYVNAQLAAKAKQMKARR